MTRISYRLSETYDPEERLEDAALWKALHDEYGGRIHLLKPDDPMPQEGIFFGRTKKNEKYGSGDLFPYWNDPGFQAGIRRRVTSCDLEQAREVVQAIHDDGRDAFVKATRIKFLTMHVPRGQSLMQALGDTAYSFIDQPGCLLVQDHLRMRHERRFVVMGGAIVTHSPVATHLTPLARSLYPDIENMHFPTPRDQVGYHDPQLTQDMLIFAGDIARETELDHVVIDIADVAGTPEVIEFNPCLPGQFGLFACDPAAIARGTRAMLTPDIIASPHQSARMEQYEDDPFDDSIPI